MGVAKIRFTEQMLKNVGERVVNDPYAAWMFPGSTIMKLMGHGLTSWLFDKASPGLMELIVGRTAFIDETVKRAVSGGALQYIILGAGYDMRAYRLNLPGEVKIFEVDQPSVQDKKKAKVGRIPDLPKANVTYVPIDFNANESLPEKLLKSEGYDPNVPTIVTLEGVTQYIPATSVAQTVADISGIVPEGSTLFCSYAPDAARTDPNCATLLENVKRVGEPWINFYASPKDIFEGSTFSVAEDIGVSEVNSKFFAPKGRPIPLEKYCVAERYAVATK